MKQGLLSWSPCRLFPHPHTKPNPYAKPLKPIVCAIAATLESVNEAPLSARERRKLRNERRESKPAYNWREEVEERLIKKPKKRYASWTEELNLDNLALLGPQWWAVRVARVNGHYTAERLAQSLALNFPEMDFKLYIASVQVKRKLKNGSISVKPKPLFPGCVFLRCVLNKEIHDFIREYDGVGGFIGSKVGNKKKQINKPRPVDTEDIEAIFKKAKEEQEKADEAFEEAQNGEGNSDSDKPDVDSVSASKDVKESAPSKKRGKQSKKALDSRVMSPLVGRDGKLLVPGSTVQVVSGSFAGFSGILKKLDRRAGLVRSNAFTHAFKIMADSGEMMPVRPSQTSLPCAPAYSPPSLPGLGKGRKGTIFDISNLPYPTFPEDLLFRDSL